MAERLKAHDWKSCIVCSTIEGSNPSLSATVTTQLKLLKPRQARKGTTVEGSLMCVVASFSKRLDLMSYLVLARKYRPQTFFDVVGQDVIVQTLCKALNSGRIAHAFLFTGSRGVGKTSIARLLAKALACEKGISNTPCGQCSHCVEITSGTSIDVIEIDGASNTSVDDVRALRETIRYQPSSCRFKIFIIDEVHMLSNSAFNALLKTLEEPPPHVKFIFATTESHKIPVTILSRCQRYDFKRLDVETITDRLTHILRIENISIDPEGLTLIAKAAEGGMRDALSLADQVISFASQHISSEDVTKILGLMDRQSIVQATDALIHFDAKSALGIIHKAMLNGYDLKQLIDGVATELRHLSIATSVGSIMGFAELSKSEINLIDQKAKSLDAADLQRLFAMALDSIDKISHSEQPKLMIELAFLRMADRPVMAETATIIHAISRLESLSRNADIPIFVQKVIASPAAKETVSPLANIDQSWLRFVNLCIDKITTLGHHLEHARFNKVTNEQSQTVIHIELDQQLHYQSIVDAIQHPAAQALLNSVYGKNAYLKPVLTTKQTTLPPATMTITQAREIEQQQAQEALQEQAKNHPIVQKAISLFGGEIRSVKRND
jgi:DNA polymerase III subunit gamma/tau